MWRRPLPKGEGSAEGGGHVSTILDRATVAMLGFERILPRDFAALFGWDVADLPADFGDRLDRIDTSHRQPALEEFEEYLLHVLERMSGQNAARTPDENLDAWERGWGENLALAADGPSMRENLRPRYFRPSKFLRYRKGLIVSENSSLEYDLFDLARYLIFSRYLSPYDDIYELGCGSCQNLLALSEIYPAKQLHGLDWARPSVEIAKLLARSQGRKISGHLFDMTNPAPEVTLEPGSAVVTIHAMEQLGSFHRKLLAFLLECRPGLVIHYEPILEFYDRKDPLDLLAVVYSEKRNYLTGLWPALLTLRDEGRIEILEARRPHLGGVIHEASLLVWRPR